MFQLVLLIVGLSTNAFAKKEDLTEAERNHIAALRVWMEEKEVKGWTKLKTSAERDQWLKDNGEPIRYWERFYQYNEEQRTAILDGEVRTGWTADRVFMAWGKPYMKKRLTGRNAGRSELLLYRFEVTADGSVMLWEEGSKASYVAVEKYTMQVFVDDNVLTELSRQDGWQ